MAVCSRCRRRKAKRECPALGSALCSLCCGQARNRDFSCPESCRFLAESKPYQERRAVSKKEALSASGRPQDDILRDERLAWLASHIEFPIKVYGQRNSELTDGQVVLTLEYARDQLEKAGRVLILPGEALKPRNELGDAVLKNMAGCRYERAIIVPGADQAYSREEQVKVLDGILASARELARDSPSGRSYIDRLIQHFERVEELSSRKKVDSPR
jgi:hypothetical protein